jgi:transposase-like protein
LNADCCPTLRPPAGLAPDTADFSPSPKGHDLCNELDISPNLFYGWLKAFFENGHAAFDNGRKTKTVVCPPDRPEPPTSHRRCVAEELIPVCATVPGRPLWCYLIDPIQEGVGPKWGYELRARQACPY